MLPATTSPNCATRNRWVVISSCSARSRRRRAEGVHGPGVLGARGGQRVLLGLLLGSRRSGVAALGLELAQRRQRGPGCGLDLLLGDLLQVGVHHECDQGVLAEGVRDGLVEGRRDLGLQDLAGQLVRHGDQQRGAHEAPGLGQAQEAAVTRGDLRVLGHGADAFGPTGVELRILLRTHGGGDSGIRWRCRLRAGARVRSRPVIHRVVHSGGQRLGGRARGFSVEHVRSPDLAPIGAEKNYNRVVTRARAHRCWQGRGSGYPQEFPEDVHSMWARGGHRRFG